MKVTPLIGFACIFAAAILYASIQENLTSTFIYVLVVAFLLHAYIAAENVEIRSKRQSASDFCNNYKSNNYNIKQMELGPELYKAIEENQFVVYYQPIINLADNRIIGAEALVRWEHPQKGLIAPLDFIPLAENLRLIEDIDEMVLESACMQLNAWGHKVSHDFKLAVNLSADQFKSSGLDKTVEKILAKTGVEPHNLELELTEGILLEGSDAIKSTILNLAAMGVSISLDDFGTGYSSLSYLKKFSIDKLKIDRSFINDLNHSTVDESLVKAIIAMSRSLKLSVLAEGVETKEQLEIIRNLGCDQAQGFYFAKPMPAQDFTKLLDLQS